MATIIKADGTGGPQVEARAIAFNYHDVVTQASSKLEQVRQQAGQILAEARSEADRLKQQAQQQGKAAAEAEARKNIQLEVKTQLAGQLQTLRPALESAIEQVTAVKLACMRQWEQNMVQMATAIAGRVIRQQLEVNPKLGLPLVREALELAVGCQQVTIRLNPTDLASLGDEVELIVKQFKQIGTPEMVADPALQKGCCVVDTEFGQIDQQWETQLRRIEEELR